MSDDPYGVEEGAAAFEDDGDDDWQVPDTEEEQRALEEAEADIRAGRVVPHERVREWLAKLAKGEHEPPPFSWRK